MYTQWISMKLNQNKLTSEVKTMIELSNKSESFRDCMVTPTKSSNAATRPANTHK